MPSRMFVVFGAIISAVARLMEFLAAEKVEWNPKESKHYCLATPSYGAIRNCHVLAIAAVVHRLHKLGIYHSPKIMCASGAVR